MSHRIYVVEDDPTISALLCENLRRWGFETRCCADFSDVTGELFSFDPHLVLMDISLPFFNGYYWCTEIRRRSNVPILFLSSRTDNMDIVMAVNVGADDYVTKPFSTDVLVAKINALLRRAYSYAADPPLCAKGVSLSAADGTLSFGDKKLGLTKNELRIMHTLLSERDAVVTREAIMKALWDSDCFVDDNTLTVNINRLRAKLAQAEFPDLIETKKGMGYVIHD
ncbi:MAG: response regulator transcription factor [Oscillospiraceae bacterium]|nr:response regulator transcription factor [Oscillospiraceae bacterium]